MIKNSVLRLGLCCKFINEDIRFSEMRYIHFKKLLPSARAEKLNALVLNNAQSLLKAVHFCYLNKILAFRVGSDLLPLYTHDDCTYAIEDLKDSVEIFNLFRQVKQFITKHNFRLTFHPDQFVILNSPRDDVVEKSIRDLEYHNYCAELIGADVINIHGGGVYGDKSIALKRLEKNIRLLSKEIRSRLTLENDDKSYTPSDLLPLCKELEIPLVYDVHHHRCLPDQMGEEEASRKAYHTWNREPLFHLSSPKEGWQGSKPERHHDYIDVKDFPLYWNELGPLTVDVEAKAKELAVLKLIEDLKLH